MSKFWAVGWLALVGSVGCASTKSSNTARTASEQLLISSAIDRACGNVRFEEFAGRAVFVDDQYLDSVDKGYLVSTIRHRVLGGGGRLAKGADDADLVLEVRSGGVGTDTQSSFIGTPSIGVPGLPIEIPEIKLISRNTQLATAKIGLVAYDPTTGAQAGSGGTSNALSHHKDSYVMGVGPFRSGSVVDQRQRSVGFDGIGGSIGGSRRLAVRPVSMIDGAGARFGGGLPDPVVPPTMQPPTMQTPTMPTPVAAEAAATIAEGPQAANPFLH